MSSSNNSFENIIVLFKSICCRLEAKAELDLKEVEKQCQQDFAANVKILNTFDDLISGISETCTELINSHEILEYASKKALDHNSINLPYEIQSDFVNCIKGLYNMAPLNKNFSEDKLIKESDKQSISDIIRISEKIIADVREVENTVDETKQII